MKNILIIILFIGSLTSFSQDRYVCTADLSNIGREGEYEYKTYERVGNKFRKTSQFGDSWFKIQEETSSFILLINSTNSYPSIFITFIDKRNGTFYEKFVTPDNGEGTTGTYKYEIRK